MQTFKAGTKVFIDALPPCGKPKGKVTKVIEPGSGRKVTSGRIEVEITKTVKGYKKGEIIVMSAYTVVPLKMVLPRKKGEYFTRINTCYDYK